MAGPGRAGSLLLRNARLRLGPGLAEAESVSVVIDGGVIRAIGPHADVARTAHAGATAIDLEGHLVLPGFVDAHTHLGWAGEAYWRVNWATVSDRAAALDRVRLAAERVAPGFWLVGGGWSRETLADSELPTLPELDAAAGDKPLFLQSEDGSLALANTHALALFRIEPTTAAPAGGSIERDARGAATGRLLGTAARARMTAGVVPPPDRYRRRAELRAALRELARRGITEAHDIATFPRTGPTPLVNVERGFTDASLYDDLAAQGDLPVRVDIRPHLSRWEDTAAEVRRRGGRVWADGLLSCRGLKEILDDGRFSAPGGDGGYEFRYAGRETTLQRLQAAERVGLDVTLHGLGDLAVTEALDLFEAADASAPPRAERRRRLVHARRVAPTDLERISRLGVVVEAQPWDVADRLPDMERRFGADFLATAFPFRTLLDHGARLAFSSDWRILPHRPDGLDMDPLVGMYVATTRCAPDGGGGPWQPEQRLSVAEAIAAYTAGGAWAAGTQQRRGRLAPGMDADLVVLSHDVVEQGPASLLEARPLLTVVAGRVTWAR